MTSRFQKLMLGFILGGAALLGSSTAAQAAQAPYWQAPPANGYGYGGGYSNGYQGGYGYSPYDYRGSYRDDRYDRKRYREYQREQERREWREREYRRERHDFDRHHDRWNDYRGW